ncbi:MAG: hypothetical protein ABIF92_00150, partial [archaeon]
MRREAELYTGGSLLGSAGKLLLPVIAALASLGDADARDTTIVKTFPYIVPVVDIHGRVVGTEENVDSLIINAQTLAYRDESAFGSVELKTGAPIDYATLAFNPSSGIDLDCGNGYGDMNRIGKMINDKKAPAILKKHKHNIEGGLPPWDDEDVLARCNVTQMKPSNYQRQSFYATPNEDGTI